MEEGLSKQFVLEVMKTCWEHHKRQHVHENYPGAIKCDLETCPPQWYNAEEGETAEEAFEWDHTYRQYHIDLGPENVQVLSVERLTGPEEDNYGCTHYVEMCYTVGTQLPEWHAGYGVNEETGSISCWCD